MHLDCTEPTLFQAPPLRLHHALPMQDAMCMLGAMCMCTHAQNRRGQRPSKKMPPITTPERERTPLGYQPRRKAHHAAHAPCTHYLKPIAVIERPLH